MLTNLVFVLHMNVILTVDFLISVTQFRGVKSHNHNSK